MRPFRPFLLASFCAVCLLAWDGSSRAQEPSARYVWLALSPSLADAEGLTSAVDAQLADVGLSVRRTRGEGGAPEAALALARSEPTQNMAGVVWLEQRGPDLFVWTIPHDAKRALLRSLPAPSAQDYAAQETVAVVVRSSIEALASGVQVGFESPAASPQPASEPAAPVERATMHGELGIGYAGQWFAPGLDVQHGARLTGSLRGLVVDDGYLQVAVSLLRGEQLARDGVLVLLTRTPLELLAGYRFEAHGFGLAPELGVGLDVTARSADARAPDVKVTSDRRMVTPYVLGRLWLLRALGGKHARTWLALGGGLDVAIGPVDYTLDVQQVGSMPSSTRSVLVSPRTLRPVALLQWVVKL